jgi:hypothetical protein
MTSLQPPPPVSTSADAPVSGEDWMYASDMLEDVSLSSPCVIRKARLRLFAGPGATAEQAAIADAVLTLETGSVICAGSVASSMSEAVDDLGERLRRRLAVAGSRAAPKRQTYSRRWISHQQNQPGMTGSQ